MSSLLRRGGLFAPASLSISAAVSIVLLIIIVPVPNWMIDVFLGISLSASVLMLMVAININKALMFSSFPSVLLILTLLRLSLSLSTTRAILADGEAGKIVETFGRLVAAGNLIVGMVLFALITIVQMLVITKGAERVAEVAARFTLDAMPGRQMSIDADLRAGSATQEEVRERRSEVARESELYGALDGAMKFVKGDAIAGLIFVIVNLIGGVAIGVLQRGMTFAESANIYSILTIGDGLAAQLPSLLTSITAGFIVSRVRDENRPGGVGEQLVGELVAQPRGLLATAALLLGLAFVPGLPSEVFLVLAAGFAGCSYWRVRKSRVDTSSPFDGSAGIADSEASGSVEEVQEFDGKIGMVPLRPLMVRHNVKSFSDAGGESKKLLQAGRQRLYLDLGVLFPEVTVIRDDSMLAGDLDVLVNEVSVAKYSIVAGHGLVSVRRGRLQSMGIAGPMVPAMGGDFTWVPEPLLEEVERAGIKSFTSPAMVVEHVLFAARWAASDFLGIQQVRELIAGFEVGAPDLIKEASKIITIPRVADVLQRLVSENVSIRDFGAILTALIEHAGREKDPLILTELVRGHIRRQICGRISRLNSVIPAFTCSAELEGLIRDSIRQTSSGSYLSLPRASTVMIAEEFRRHIGDIADRVVPPIVICSPDVRRYVRKLLEPEYLSIAVLSYNELVSELNIHTVGEFRVKEASVLMA